MIISRTPVRVSIGGGGTDLPFFQPRFGAEMVTSTINRYIYVSVNPRFDGDIRVSYSKTEIVDDIDELQHTRVREALRLLEIQGGIEITTIADVPSGTGLGTSSSFLVGLLNALHAFKREYVDTRTLAEEACKIEIEVLEEPIGRQDQYAAAYGGIISLTIDSQDGVLVSPVHLTESSLHELEANLFMFYTGVRRSTSHVLAEQKREAEADERKIEGMAEIKRIGQEIRACLERGDCRQFGALMHRHWETKRNFTSAMSSTNFDETYERGLQSGAVGGKIMGAGGGGFFLFYCDADKNAFVRTMEKGGLKRIPFRFEMDGSKIIFNA